MSTSLYVDISSDYYVITIPEITIPLLLRIDQCSTYQRKINYSKWHTRIHGVNGIYHYRGNIGIELDLTSYFSEEQKNITHNQQRLIITVPNGTIGLENAAIQDSISAESIVNKVQLERFTDYSYMKNMVYLRIGEKDVFCIELDFEQLHREILDRLHQEGYTLQQQTAKVIKKYKIQTIPLEKKTAPLRNQTVNSEMFRVLPKEKLENYEFIFRVGNHTYSCNLPDIVGLVKDSFFTITSSVVNPWILGTYAFQKRAVPIVNPSILSTSEPTPVPKTSYIFTGVILKANEQSLCIPVDEIIGVITQREKAFSTTTIFPIVAPNFLFTQFFLYNNQPIVKINTQEFLNQYYENSVEQYYLDAYTVEFNYVKEDTKHQISEGEEESKLQLLLPLSAESIMMYEVAGTANFIYHEKLFGTPNEILQGWFVYNGRVCPVLRIFSIFDIKISDDEYQNILVINYANQDSVFAITLPEKFIQQDVEWTAILDNQQNRLLQQFLPKEINYERVGFGIIEDKEQLIVQISENLLKESAQQMSNFTVENKEELEVATQNDEIRKRINFEIKQLYEDLNPAIVFEHDSNYIGMGIDLIETFVGDEEKLKSFVANQQEEFTTKSLVGGEKEVEQQYFKLVNTSILLGLQNVYDILYINTINTKIPEPQDLESSPELQKLLIGIYKIPDDEIILPGETIYLIDPSIEYKGE